MILNKFFLLILFLISSIYANHIAWLGDYQKALKKAQTENKVLMVLLIKNGCIKCKNIVKNIFTNRYYIDELNKNIVAVIVNIDNKHSFPLEMYWSNTYPTLFFVNSQNETFINKPFYNITQKDIKAWLDKFK